MFVLTPHPCVLVCVRVCVCVPAAWIVWIASETTLRVLFWAEARGRRPGAGPEKKSTWLFPPPAESTGTQQRAREMRLSSAFVWAVQTSKLWSKKTLFFFFFTFFLLFFFCIVVSYTRILCTTVYRYLHQFIQFKIYAHARLRRSQKVPGIELCSVRPTGGPTFHGFAC